MEKITGIHVVESDVAGGVVKLTIKAMTPTIKKRVEKLLRCVVPPKQLRCKSGRFFVHGEDAKDIVNEFIGELRELAKKSSFEFEESEL